MERQADGDGDIQLCPVHGGRGGFRRARRPQRIREKRGRLTNLIGGSASAGTERRRGRPGRRRADDGAASGADLAAVSGTERERGQTSARRPGR